MRAAEFLTDAYYNKNAHYMDDRSINPATGKPYLQFGSAGTINPADWVAMRNRDSELRNHPSTSVYPSHKVAQRSLNGYKNKDDLKIVRGGVSKYKIVSRDDPAPELFGE